MCLECMNSDNGATDTYGATCTDYTEEAALGWATYGYNWCGQDDDEDFSSMDMCCVCQEEEAGTS